jgi:hypothetical protein
MDSALNLLKQEINATVAEGHDLAKWKLVVTAALGVAAFGLTEKNKPCYWVLLFVPFVCVYIDLYTYQMRLRVQVIAKFLREHPEGDAVLQKYELECQKLRGPHRHVFDVENLAGLTCSLFVSGSGPVLYFLLLLRGRASLDDLLISPAAAGIVWLFGVFLIVLLYKVSKRMGKPFSGSSDSVRTAPVA